MKIMHLFENVMLELILGGLMVNNVVMYDCFMGQGSELIKNVPGGILVDIKCCLYTLYM